VAIATKIDRTGRVLIPLKVRRELGLTESTDLILHVENGELRMHTREAAIMRARERLKKLKKPGESIVDEFLAERREEARRELEELDR
jgi:bifunctional DNA-binding transcriptional regulator/antitoxin component of YhaV-PrlF toxin-antitoxin module